jgi:predicted Zn-ribbon and HTH transcriptional regulator
MTIINAGVFQKRIVKCEHCGHVFTGFKVFLVLTRCPKCGSLNVKKDKRVRH